MDIGEKLKMLRKERKLTQSEVGDAIGQERSTIACYETGKRTPDVVTLEKLAVLYNVTLDYFSNKSNGDIMIELLARSNAFFTAQNISDSDKDKAYQTIMRLYLQAKEYQESGGQNITANAKRKANKN